MFLQRLVELAKHGVTPSANGFYSTIHPPLVAGFPHPSAVRIQSGREPLWVNLGYWRDVEHVAQHNIGRAAELLENAQRAMAELLARTGQLRKTDVVLDCGFGYGDQDILWAENHCPRLIRGLNVSKLQVELARQRIDRLGLDTTVDLRLGSATQIPFAGSEFDLVFALESAFHFDTRHKFLAEAFRVLRSGGRLVLADILRASTRPPSLFEAAVHRWGRRAAVIPEDNVWSPPAYQTALCSLGFRDIVVESIADHVFRPFSKAVAAFGLTPFGLTNPMRAPARGVTKLLHEASHCDFERLVWPRLFGLDEYALICAVKP
jgi:cyclopropane fatty-acyl-phospholipid synthase-like methyltransferase